LSGLHRGGLSLERERITGEREGKDERKGKEKGKRKRKKKKKM
jgi:hypothetical protein